MFNLLICVVLCILTGIVFYYYYYLSALKKELLLEKKKREKLQEQLSRKQSDVSKLCVIIRKQSDMLEKYLMPGDKLKKELVNNLKRIPTFEHIIEFCDTLDTAHFIVSHCEGMVSRGCLQMSDLLEMSDDISERFKKSLATISVKVLMEKLSVIMRNEIKPMDESNLRSVLEETDTPNSLEYLKRIVNSFEYMAKFYCSVPSVFCSSGSIKDITEFVRCVYTAAYSCAMSILSLMFQICLDKVEASEEEKSGWCYLLFKAAEVIKQSIENYRHRSGKKLPYFLQMRSCIQCVLDLFAESPGEYVIASKELNNITKLKDYYDNTIEILLKYDYYDCDTMRRKILYKRDTFDFLSNVPPSHTWWEKLEFCDE